MGIQLKNNATTTITVAVAPGDTTITTADGSVFPTLGANDYFYCTLSNADFTIQEIVKVTAISANDITVIRAQEGTIANSFIVGDIFEQRATAQTLIDLVDEVNTSKRMYLDELTIGYEANAKLTESKIASAGDKQMPHLIQNWDSYFGPKLKNTILDLTNNTIVADGIVFNTIKDISDWLIANYPGNTPTLVLKPYETVNSDIPSLTKMYGMNRFFSSLKGKKGNSLTKSVIKDGFLSKANMNDIFNSVHSTTANNITNKTIWIANNKKNMYGTLHTKASIIHSTTGGGIYREEYVTANSACSAIPLSTDYKRTNKTPMIASLDHSLNVITYKPTFHSNIDNEVSRVLVYPLENSDGSAKSVMIKPIGMDTFVMDFPDFNTYILEAVAFNNNMQGSTKIKSFTSTTDFSSFTNFDYTNGKMRLDIFEVKALMASVNQKSSNSTYSDNQSYNTVRFRLRNKVTNEVSELTKYAIIYDNSHKFGRFRYMTTYS